MIRFIERRFGWLRGRQQAERLAQADAEALIRDHDAEAYGEARRREREVVLPDGTTHAGRTPAHWRRVALIVARMTGNRLGADTATRMLQRGCECAQSVPANVAEFPDAQSERTRRCFIRRFHDCENVILAMHPQYFFDG